MLRPAHEMIVVVDQTRQHGASLEIHHLRGFVGQDNMSSLVPAAMNRSAAVANPSTIENWVVDRNDLAVDVDDLGGRGSP